MSENVEFKTLFETPLRNGVSYPSRSRGLGVPMINMREVFAFDRISDQECERVPLTEKEIQSYLLKPRDLLFARQSLTYEGAGKCVLVLNGVEPRTWESHLMRVRLDQGQAWPAFYFYFFKSATGRRVIETIVQQVAAAGIRGSDLGKLPVPKPPLSRQRAIAEVLGALDDKIAANYRVVASLRDLARARFLRRAADGIEVRISEVVSLLTRGVTPKYAENRGMLVLNQKCVRNQAINLDPARFMEPLSSRLDRLLCRNDVLVNSTGAGTLGRVARWTRDIDATVDSHITIVRFDEDLVDPVCGGYAMLGLERQIEGLAEGSTGQTELRRELLGAMTLALPPPDDQRPLGRALANHDALELALVGESQDLARTRDELLPLLMSGKLRVKDAEAVVSDVV